LQTKSCIWAAFVIVACSTHAQAQRIWVKSSHNPIIPAQEGFSGEPAVIFDANAQKYKMWYSAVQNGVSHIYCATSSDGVDWSNYPDNPVLRPGPAGTWDSYHVRSSTVIYKDGEYHLYYFASGVLSGLRIGLAKSQDGIHWEKFQGNPILSPGEQGSWDSDVIYHPKAIHDGTKFYMWYAGSDGYYVRGGLATSTDGEAWEKHPANPVLLPGPSGSWDEYRVWPSAGVVIHDDKFAMLYTGVIYANPSNSSIGLATSIDGIVWEKDENNPVLSAGLPGAWDHEGLGNASLLFDGERFKLWFGGHDANGAWHIGYAESAESDAEDFALQFDGLDDLVQINDTNGALDLNDFTLEAWVWRMEENTTEEIIHKGGVGENSSVNTNYAILFRSDNFARAHFELADSRNLEVAGTTRIQTGQWYHIAGVHSASDRTLKIYVNGVLDGPPLQTEGAPNQQDSPVRLGANDPGWNLDENFKGIIDEVRIWKIARTQEQIQAAMHSQLTGQERGLVAYWRLDEGAGQNAYDRTAFGNHGVRGLSLNAEAQDPIWVTPPPLPSDSSNFALDFDGVDDHVLFEPNLFETPQQITMEAWVKYQSTKTYMMVISLEVYAFFLNRFEVGTFTPFFDGGSIHANDHAYGANLNDGRWHHLAAVNDGQTLQVFIDGVFMGSVSETIYDVTSLNRTSAIGAQFDASEFHFDGIIDEVRVWNVARTPEQIQKNMHERLNGNEAGLVAYWRLDEGSGQVINDAVTPPHPGHRGASENPDAADPTWVLANRTPGTGCIGIPLPAGEAYGNINQNRQTHSDKITYCFDGPTGDRFLSFAVYDIDQNNEVGLSLNGETLMYAPITANNTWSSLIGVLLSDTQIHDGHANALVFDNTRNPPQNWRWGARQVSVDPFYALPSPAAYGNIPGGDTQHKDKVVYFFSGRSGDLNLAYQVFDIDHFDEVDVVLNDTKILDEAPTSNETWSETRNLLLPDELVHNTGINVLIFENTKNPPRNWRWGVRNVSVSVATTSSLALPSQAGANFSGQHVQNAQYLLDGQLAPMVRPQGDDGVSDTSRYVIEGATTIAPNGYVIIALPAAQKIDYLGLYPEWHASRFFSYRVEASEDGRNWSTAADKMNLKLHGPQIERIAKAGVRYLRLTGFSVVVDPDSALGGWLNETAYWQAYESFLQQAQPEALAIAELVLIKQEGNVSVDEPVTEAPTQYRLEQNLPNPFNPATIIRFNLPQAERVHLAIYNLRGELVRTLVDGNLPAGAHAFTFEASGLATGVYFYRMTTERFSEVKKMLLAK